MPRNLDPEIRHAVLQVAKLPEQGLVNARVAVPALVLATRECVHVDDGVQPRGGAGVDDAVDEPETLGLDARRGVSVVEEVPVVDGDADAVEAQRREELGVGWREEVLEELVSSCHTFFPQPHDPVKGREGEGTHLVEEEVVLFPAKYLKHGGPHLVLVAGEAGDEVLHVGVPPRRALPRRVIRFAARKEKNDLMSTCA